MKIFNDVKNKSIKNKMDKTGIHSIRFPGFISQHKIIFEGISENLTIKSSTMKKHALFPGICFACNVVSQLNGLVYGLDNLI